MVVSKDTPKVGQIRIDNKKSIIEAAKVEFAKCGFSGASMNQIADTARLSRPNVYYYFGSKEELYTQVLTGVLRDWQGMFDPISVDDDPGEALGAYIKAKVAYSKSNPLASKIFANEILHGASFVREYLKGQNRTWLREKTEIIDSWINQGKMDPVDPLHLIFMIWASTQHYADFEPQVTVSLGKKRLGAKDYETATETLTQVILKGCGIDMKINKESNGSEVNL